jgi:ring-1,2-phenylacetyl-CoA epoxidase subunit PaaD
MARVETEMSDDLDRVRSIAGAVADPEIPVLTLADLGVVRHVEQRNGQIVVGISPTYIGCPAVLAIELAVGAALAEAGFENATVERVLAPAWSTDDMTAAGRLKLKEYGIAPPAKAPRSALFASQTVECPRCGSPHTSRIAEFGSTACKALWRCEACREPFEYFKCL